ncbi:MAG: hypothetical protein WA091_00735 [Minisyncoccales bacterium]
MTPIILYIMIKKIKMLKNVLAIGLVLVSVGILMTIGINDPHEIKGELVALSGALILLIGYLL